MAKKRIVVLTGAGISAESGITTFRDSGGLWEKYRIEDVATPSAWQRNPDLVNNFYNERRKQILASKPNKAHYILVELEKFFEVIIITQNVDDLHERAGSSKVMHLHGEIRKVRSTINSQLIYDLEGWELNIGDKCELGGQLRPHIVWFGEMVPMMDKSISVVASADILVVIGTSLQVYPASSLINYADRGIPKFYVDPMAENQHLDKGFYLIKMKASVGLVELKEKLLQLIV